MTLMRWSSAPALWDKDLQLHKGAIQAMDKTKGLVVLQERARWLNLITYSIKKGGPPQNYHHPAGSVRLSGHLDAKEVGDKKKTLQSAEAVSPQMHVCLHNCNPVAPAPNICSGSSTLTLHLQNPKIAEGAGSSTGTTKTLPVTEEALWSPPQQTATHLH